MLRVHQRYLKKQSTYSAALCLFILYIFIENFILNPCLRIITTDHLVPSVLLLFSKHVMGHTKTKILKMYFPDYKS